MPIPPEARDIQVDLLLPLMDGKKVEQHEVELQMQSFISEAQTSTLTLEKKSLEKEDDMSIESMKEDINVLLKGIAKLDFEHPHIYKNITPKSLQHMAELPANPDKSYKKKKI